MNKRIECLELAQRIVNGERQEVYGTPEDNFRVIAEPSAAEVYARIKKLCKAEELTTEELCLDLGLTRFCYNNWSRKLPGRKNLIQIAEYFGVSLDWLLFGTDPLEDVKGLICDRYCKWPEQVESVQELIEKCKYCPLTQEGL